MTDATKAVAIMANDGDTLFDTLPQVRHYGKFCKGFHGAVMATRNVDSYNELWDPGKGLDITVIQ